MIIRTNFRDRFASLAILLLFFPLFLGPSGVFNSTEYSARGVPISLSLTVILVVWLGFMRPVPRKPFIFLLCFVLSVFCSFSFGVLLHSGSMDVVVFLTYVVPALVGFGAFLTIRNGSVHASLEDVLKSGGRVVVAVAFAWSIYHVYELVSGGRANGSVWGVFVIYQVWVYWPTMLAVVFVASFVYRNPFGLLAKSILAVAIIVSGAREPILFAFVGLFLALIARGRVKDIAKLTAVSVVLGFAVIQVIEMFPDLTVVIKIMRIINGDQGLTGGRAEVLEVFDFASLNIFFGNGFLKDEFAYASTHNQYLDIYFRGGLVALFPVLSMPVIWLAMRRSMNNYLWGAMGALFLVSYNINVPLRSPYLGAVIWTVFFFAIDEWSRKAKTTS